MAVAEIIGAAVGVLLLVVVAYVLVGGTLTAAETVATAQKDLTLLNEARLRTSFNISSTEPLGTCTTGPCLNFSITNNGNEAITDLPHMDVFSFDTVNGYIRYTYVKKEDDVGDPKTWTIRYFGNDEIHTGELDPGVTLWIKTNLPSGSAPTSIQVTTGNGVSTSSKL
ncbi:MAG: hypothetical protein LUQ50_03855 [Methanospirillum sp.]|uniref:hypothetical protein n=1 Tax=Methanospirillum sp. TaxID=45200 RepID=UPI002374C584|nr:hypothetical protein [Methanospirillum sp.]MDD1728189.1 hypothetical protein [Methanospirillum sp.]